jgi:chromosome segregation ATPase
VGILEKIAQSMLTPGPGSNQSTRQELEQQYVTLQVMSWYGIVASRVLLILTMIDYSLACIVIVEYSYCNCRYQVQLDVLRQLEARTREQLQTQRKIKPNINNNSEANKQQTLIKLERDFDRVQVIATNTKAKVARQQKQLQQRGQANAANAARNNNNNTPTHINAAAESLQQDQQRFQLQLQQDRLHQEIMTEREQEIRNINKGMHQVNEIYKDLAHIVGSQQEHVDQIETQMDNAKGNAESGLSQVQKANEKYNQSQCTIS